MADDDCPVCGGHDFKESYYAPAHHSRTMYRGQRRMPKYVKEIEVCENCGAHTRAVLFEGHRRLDT